MIDGARPLLVALAQLPPVRHRDPAACNALFARLLEQYPFYANIGANEPNGDIFCSGLSLVQPVSSADRVWFQRAVATRSAMNSCSSR